MTKIALVVLLAGAWCFAGALPSSFDLRKVEGKSFVTQVKKQSGGTCWTFATMAAVESNLQRVGTWITSGETGEASLAEYHLDWWNGFNRHSNPDIHPKTGGLTVHQGGDYRVASAYLSRGGGAVRAKDGQSFSTAPQQKDASFRFYYVRDIEWLADSNREASIERMKKALMEHGVLGTALAWSGSFYSNNTFYQPPSSKMEPNHAVAIIGWDDAKKTKAPKPGAWLVKNSWGKGWGKDGYFWISFYDKVTGAHPEMGAVSFQHTDSLGYNGIYFHDLHGWRDTKPNVTEAFNAFVSTADKERLKAVSFFSAGSDVEYQVRVYRDFANGELKDEVALAEGRLANPGLHTVDLSWPLPLSKGDKFFLYVKLSKGGFPIDKTSNVPVLLGATGRATVESKASPGESFYRKNGQWVDLTTEVATGNFTMKGLTTVDWP